MEQNDSKPRNIGVCLYECLSMHLFVHVWKSEELPDFKDFIQLIFFLSVHLWVPWEVGRLTLTTMAFESSWWASSSLTAILEIWWERTFWRVVQSAFLQILLGISLRPKPRRNAPVTNPNVFEQAIAKPRTPPCLLTKRQKNCPNHESFQ